MDYSKIMIKAWKYRGQGLNQSEALKKAWENIKTSKEMLFKLKKELEEQLKSVEYQIQQLENPEPIKKTYTIDINVRDNKKVWGAIITGLSKKYMFKREFKSYRYLHDTSSKHVYYNYYIDVKEGDFFEISGKSHKYMQLKNDEFVTVKPEEIKAYYEKMA